MALITCPYCLTPSDFRSTKCEACERDVPTRYLDNARRQEPIWVVTFGITHHGKTSYLHSLITSLVNTYKINGKAVMTGLDEPSRILIQNALRHDQTAQIQPASTQWAERPVPLLMTLENFPGTTSNTFVIYDLPGELVKPGQARPEYVKAVQKAQTVWFIVSLHDLYDDTEGRSMPDLFMSYQLMMDTLDAPIENRNIVVMYTKADKLYAHYQDELELTPTLGDYLDQDPYARLKEMRRTEVKHPLNPQAYLAEMAAIDQVLRDYTEDAGGGMFIAMAEARNASLHFTMNTATGGDPTTTGNAGQQIRRTRVLDGILWAITLSGTEALAAGEATLILPQELASYVYRDGVVGRCFNELKRRGKSVTTYVVGERDPIFSVGTTPTAKIPTTSFPFIGPILDTLPSYRAVVVLLDEQPPLDLSDFIYTPWSNYLLLVTPRRDSDNTLFPYRYYYRPESDLELAVSDFLKHV